MTRAEIVEALKRANVDFDARANKVTLQGIYDRLHVHRERPIIAPVKPAGEPAGEPSGEPSGEPTGEPSGEPAGEPTGEPLPPANEFDELLGKISGAKAPEPKQAFDFDGKPLIEGTKRKRKKGESSPESFRVEGYVLLLVTDTIFPFTLAFLNNIIDKKVKVELTQLQLCENDFKKLEPLADQAADYMSINLNPIAGFLLISTFMYANNLISVRMQIEKTI